MITVRHAKHSWLSDIRYISCAYNVTAHKAMWTFDPHTLDTFLLAANTIKLLVPRLAPLTWTDVAGWWAASACVSACSNARPAHEYCARDACAGPVSESSTAPAHAHSLPDENVAPRDPIRVIRATRAATPVSAYYKDEFKIGVLKFLLPCCLESRMAIFWVHLHLGTSFFKYFKRMLFCLKKRTCRRSRTRWSCGGFHKQIYKQKKNSLKKFDLWFQHLRSDIHENLQTAVQVKVLVAFQSLQFAFYLERTAVCDT